jgi:[amino group carrier protein]-lysine/ornithine hydrolase
MMHPISETLLNLVKIYSPSGSEQAAVTYLVSRMQALKFTRAFADEAGNAIGVMGSGPRQIILLGHIDTVPGEIPVRVETSESSDTSPILYGRGSVDAKGPLAAFTDAVAAVGALEGWQFIVIGAVGEEQDSPGARHILPRYHPEYAIIGEPSGWERVTLGYKGSAWAEITVRRPLAHTAGQGASACEIAVATWETLCERVGLMNRERPRAFDQVMPTLRRLDSGDDGFEEWASLLVGTRLPPDLPPEQWYGILEDCLPGQNPPQMNPDKKDLNGFKKHNDDQIAMERKGFSIPAYQAEKNTPLVRAFLAGIREGGGQPGFLLKTGTADLNIVAPAWGCPALAYGPGDSALDHTPDEHLSLDEYQRAVAVLQVVLERLTRGIEIKR